MDTNLGDPSDSLNSQFYKCDSSVAGNANTSSRRLSRSEQLQSFKSIFGEAFLVEPEVQSILQLIPEEPVHDLGGTFRSDLIDFNGYLLIASTLAETLLAKTKYLNSVLPNCNGTAEDADCLNALTIDFARKAFRRPLKSDEVDEIKTLASNIGGSDGLKVALAKIIMSPQHLHLIEVDGDIQEMADGRIKISSYAAASRLSFSLIGSPPDETLLSAVAAGRFNSDPDILAQAKRLMTKSEARQHFRKLVDQWIFNGSYTSDPHSDVAKYFDINPTGFGEEAKSELLDFAEYIAFDKNGSFFEIMTNKSVFAKTSRLAKAFGVTVSDGPQTLSDTRGGLLGRPAITVSPDPYSTPINRGVYIRKNILCDNLPSPDPTIIATRLDEIEALSHEDHSHRQIVTQVTSPGSCAGCHSMINPLGFALESIGPFGDFRNSELIFNNAGEVIASHEIDTQVEGLQLSSDGGQSASGVQDLVDQLSRERKVHRCFTESIFATNNKRYPADADGCSLIKLADGLGENESIQNALINSVISEDLFYRSANGGEQ